MTTILIDPWVADFSENDQSANYNRIYSIRVLLKLQQSTPLEFARFLDADFLSDFHTRYRSVFRGESGRIFFRFLSHLELDGASESEPAEFISEPIPDNCNETWCSVLAEHAESEDAPVWRCPMVMVPDVRHAEWPQGHVINFNVAGGTRVRNLVRIERYEDHPHFQPDLDPWRLQACGKPDEGTRDRDVRRPTLKRLPRPPEIPVKLSFEELRRILQGDVASTNADGTELYFVPEPTGWNPEVYDKDSWRGCRVFDKRVVSFYRSPRRGQSGYLDQKGRIWVWDIEKNHWDVQLHDGREHRNVSHTGRILNSD